MASRFDNVELGPPIEVFKLTKLFQEDKFEQKVGLGVGAYRDDNAKPWVLPVVRKAEKLIADNEGINHEYLTPLGLEPFTTAAVTMLLGNDSSAIKDCRAFGIQALSGTGALRLGAEFLARKLGYKIAYVSAPTWENHAAVFLSAGFEEIREYRYWNSGCRNIDFDGLLADLKAAPENSVIILHAVAHNPTGNDPTQEQWTKIADVMEEKKLFPFVDCAYQGFASGDPEKDAWAVRYIEERKFEFFVAQSFAKNFGLYNERAGNLTVVMNSAEKIPEVKSQFTLLVRANYSNPPHHGARIVATVMQDPGLHKEWQDCINTMSSRIVNMRGALKSQLLALKTPGTWDHITEQIGMFSYTGLTPPQCDYLINEHHIYLLRTGRISMCGLTPANVEYVAKCMNDAITKFPDCSM